MWCVVEAGTNGDIFMPEFFESKDKAMEYIDNDSKECYSTYSATRKCRQRCGRMNLALDGKLLKFPTDSKSESKAFG